MASNEFQKEIGRFLGSRFEVCERIDDASFNRSGGFQVSQKPADFFGCTTNGIHWQAEVKRVRSARFPIRNLKLHQREALIAVENNNGLAWIFINWRVNRSGQAIWIPFSEYSNIEYKIISSGRKSLGVKDFPPEFLLIRKSTNWTINEDHPLKHV